MPTWPKDTKASTLNVDQGSDQISQARADIKQNIDNVNDIIDTFDIQPDSAGQPANGDLLQYNSASGTWQPVASTAVGSPIQTGIIMHICDKVGVPSTSSYRTDLSSITVFANPGFISNVIGDSGTDNNFTLAAGTYIIRDQIVHTQGVGTNAFIRVKIDGQDSAGQSPYSKYYSHTSGLSIIEDINNSTTGGSNNQLRDIETNIVTLDTDQSFQFAVEWDTVLFDQTPMVVSIVEFQKLI